MRRIVLLVLAGLFLSVAVFAGIAAFMFERYTTGCWFNQRAALKEISHVDGARPTPNSDELLSSCSVRYVARGVPEEVISHYNRALDAEGGWEHHPISLVGSRSPQIVLNRSKGYLTYEVVALTRTDGNEAASNVSVTVYLSPEYDW